MMETIKIYLAPYLGAIKAALVVAVVIGLFAFGYHQGAKRVQTKWDAADKNRAEAERDAVAKRLAENKVIEAKQEQDKQEIKAKYDKQISDLDRKYRDSQRLRVKVDCAGLALSSQAESPGRVDAAGTVELSGTVDASLKAVAQDADKCAAKVSALQDWIRKNGMD